jgi:hypothetical protein
MFQDPEDEKLFLEPTQVRKTSAVECVYLIDIEYDNFL